MDENSHILLQPISTLPLSKEFQDMCYENGFKNLDDILQLHVNEIIELPGFNLRQLKELYQFLESFNLEGYLKEL